MVPKPKGLKKILIYEYVFWFTLTPNSDFIYCFCVSFQCFLSANTSNYKCMSLFPALLGKV